MLANLLTTLYHDMIPKMKTGLMKPRKLQQNIICKIVITLTVSN